MVKVPDDYSDRVRQLRGQLGLSQRQLAERLGVSFVTVNRWENLQSRPNRLAWTQIERAERLGLRAFTKPFVDATYTPISTVSAARDVDTGHVRTQEMTASPVLDFASDPSAVRAVAEAYRLGYGHLFNPGFAGETSLIDPLPHQRIAVYRHMLPEPRLRFLLADDAGAGKTIMAGLYIREMLSRRLIGRVLIVSPAGLVGNWEREMRQLFSLYFTVVLGGISATGNPFTGPGSDLVIISLDTLCGRRTFDRLRESSTRPYDLVIFDEAHKLAADRNPDYTVRKTERYCLAEALAGASSDHEWMLPWTCCHLLLMTATPHMGKDYPYFCLWRLLEPEEISTPDALNAYSSEARNRHFLRRLKEEMVRFDGTRIFPTRESRTVSYGLTEMEQELYDRTTGYIRTYYNRARALNRSAARLAMSVFQRRLASSTYALLRSFERRLERLNGMIRDIMVGVLSVDELASRQKTLAYTTDVFDSLTADEEDAIEGLEENQVAEDAALSGVVANTLSELMVEQTEVTELINLARAALDVGDESKFERLRELLQDPELRNEKILVFTEHRDTQDYIVRGLEALGYTGRVARIHGGMDYKERDEQIRFFKCSREEGGARCMIATDAAGEGINLQFCWIMVNYDIPWNPARLEQRMGRIHRYGQMHDPVLLFNFVAAETREGRVLKTLLDKLERIRRELGSDKVFDIIGRQFQGVSIKDLIVEAVVDGEEAEAILKIEGILTPEQVRAREAQLENVLGTTGEVLEAIPEERAMIEREELLRLVPGYVRHFLKESSPLMGIFLEGDLDRLFRIRPKRPGALDPLLPFFDRYEPHRWDRLTLYRYEEDDDVIFFRPGEPLFEGYRLLVIDCLRAQALRGAVFVDPYAERPYLFHLVLVEVTKDNQIVDTKLVGLKQEATGEISECPVEHLMFLRGAGSIPMEHVAMGAAARAYSHRAKAYASESIAKPLAERHIARLLESMEERSAYISRGYDYLAADLLRARSKLRERADKGDEKAAVEMAKVRDRQRELKARETEALAVLRHEPELIAAGEPLFLAHAFVTPSGDPEDKMRHDAEIERVAVRIACEYETARGCRVTDVSSPVGATAAGLDARPGFDLLSRHPSGDVRAIEVKGRARVGDVELTENEWAKACNSRSQYWLYVVYGCATARPRLLRVQDPFGKLFVRHVGGVSIAENEVFLAAEKEGPL